MKFSTKKKNMLFNLLKITEKKTSYNGSKTKKSVTSHLTNTVVNVYNYNII